MAKPRKGRQSPTTSVVLPYSKSKGYDDNVARLKTINTIIGMYDDNMSYAMQLFEIPLSKRMEWLEDAIHDKMMSLTVTEMNRLNDAMGALYGN